MHRQRRIYLPVAFTIAVLIDTHHQIRSRTMNSRNVVSLSALAVLGLVSAAMLVMSPGAAHAITARQLVGTWRLLSIKFTNAQGVATEPFGPHPVGSITFDAGGHFTAVIVPGEKGAATGIVANFGDYSVTNGGKTLVLHLVGSNNPSADGKDVPRAVTLSKGELKENNPNTAVASGHAEAVFKRIR